LLVIAFFSSFFFHCYFDSAQYKFQRNKKARPSKATSPLGLKHGPLNGQANARHIFINLVNNWHLNFYL